MVAVGGGWWLVGGGWWPVGGGWWLVAGARGWGAAIYNVTLRADGDCNVRVTNLDCIPLRIDPFWSAGLESLNLTCQRGRVHDDRS